MKNKFMKKVVLIAIFSLLASPVYAQKLGPTNWAGEIVNWISKQVETVTSAFEPIGEEYQTLKKGIKSKIESLEMIQMVKERAEQAKKRADSLKKRLKNIKKLMKKPKKRLPEFMMMPKGHMTRAKVLPIKQSQNMRMLKAKVKMLRKCTTKLPVMSGN